MRDGVVVAVDDFGQESRWVGVGADALAAGVRSSSSVPLHAGDRVLGGLNMYATTAGAFGDQSCLVARVIGRQGGLALRQLETQRVARIQREAETRITETLQRSCCRHSGPARVETSPAATWCPLTRRRSAGTGMTRSRYPAGRSGWRSVM